MRFIHILTHFLAEPIDESPISADVSKLDSGPAEDGIEKPTDQENFDSSKNSKKINIENNCTLTMPSSQKDVTEEIVNKQLAGKFQLII